MLVFLQCVIKKGILKLQWIFECPNPTTPQNMRYAATRMEFISRSKVCGKLEAIKVPGKFSIPVRKDTPIANGKHIASAQPLGLRTWKISLCTARNEIEHTPLKYVCKERRHNKIKPYDGSSATKEFINCRISPSHKKNYRIKLKVEDNNYHCIGCHIRQNISILGMKLGW